VAASIITLNEARLLREQLRPAFAGYVTDGNVSDRDVLGTIMNLIARGYIGVDLDTQVRPNMIRSIYLVTSSGLLLPFEKSFLRALFSPSRVLSPGGVRKKILSGVLHRVIEENTLALVESKIARKLLIVLDEKGKRKDVTFLTESGTLMHIRTVGDLVEIRKMGEDVARELASSLTMLVVFVSFLFAAGMLLYSLLQSSSTSYDLIGIVGFPLAMVMVLGMIFFLAAITFFSRLENLPTVFVRLITYLQNRSALKNTKNLLLLQFRDNVTPYMKGRYEELFDFIKAAPLKQQRIYNEFMPHAVAFGLDTSWNESFEIDTEPLVSSQVYGRAPPVLEGQVHGDEVKWIK